MHQRLSHESRELSFRRLGKKTKWNSICTASWKRYDTLPPSVRLIFEELPEMLDETYARDINKTNREHAYRLFQSSFQCLTVILRPLYVDVNHEDLCKLINLMNLQKSS